MADTSGIKFLFRFSVGEYDQLNPGDNVISVTSQAAGDHDKKNLTTTALRETWRSAGVGTQEIVIQANDLTDAPDVFAILNHNLTEDAVVTLYGSTTNNFASPALTISFTWHEKHMVITQDFGTTYEYYKIKIIDPTNPCGYFEIGRIVAGLAFTFSVNEDITDDFNIGTDDLAYKMKSEGFFRASNERVKVDRLQIRFDRLRTDAGFNTNYVGIQGMLNFIGETLPFLTILDPDDPYFSVIWGQVDTLPSRTFSVNRYTSMSFAIQEVY
jgi:hypothetical protein